MMDNIVVSVFDVNSQKVNDLLKDSIISIFLSSNKTNGYPLHRPVDLIDSVDIILVLKNLKNDKIVGYALVKFFNDSNTLLTNNDRLYNPNYQLKGVYIEQVAILPQYQNKHLGVKLYDELKEVIKNDYLLKINNIYSHVAVLNKQSMKFHCKQGFIPIGDYICDNFYGFENYHSLLLELNLK